MFCEKCGKEVQDEAVVCLDCGCSLETYSESNIDNSLKGKTTNSELYSSSWEDLKGQWGISIGFILLYAVFSVIVSFTIGLVYLEILISAPLAVGFALFWINVSRKSNPQINDMFKGFDSYGAALG